MENENDLGTADDGDLECFHFSCSFVTVAIHTTGADAY